MSALISPTQASPQQGPGFIFASDSLLVGVRNGVDGPRDSLSLSSRSEKRRGKPKSPKRTKAPRSEVVGTATFQKPLEKLGPSFSQRREKISYIILFTTRYECPTPPPHTAQTPKQSSDVISTLFFLKRISKQFEKWFLKELQGYIASGFFMYDMCCYKSVGASFFPFVCIIPNLLPRQIILLPYKTLDLHH